MITKNPFIYQGYLDPLQDSLVYIEREKELKQILNGLQDLKYYAIIAPRQTGKTTFMRQLKNKIDEDELHTHESIYITFKGVKNIEKNTFYSLIANEIIAELNTKYTILDPPWLLNMPLNIQNNIDFERFFITLSQIHFSKKVINCPHLKKKRLKYVILIDEFDCLPKELSFEFLKTIRSIFEQRFDNKGFERFSLIISGAMDLAQLSRGRNSPFNIADRVDLEDFEEQEVVDMVKKVLMAINAYFYEYFPGDVFEATNGHPYLTQKLCGKIIDNLISDKKNYIGKSDITRQIDNFINSNDINLKTIWDKIKNNKNLDILEHLLRGEKIRYNECDTFSYELKLAGAIVKDESGFCKTRNPIIYRFFHRQFLE